MTLEAFFDESGDPDDPNIHMVSIAGAITRQREWKFLATKWLAVLNRYQVSQLHRRDFAHSRGEFCSWKEDEQKRRSFLSELLKIMKEHISPHGGYLGGTIFLAAYNSLPENQKKSLISPYMPCFLACVLGASTCCLEMTPDERVELVFAEHPWFSQTATHLYNYCLNNQTSPPELRASLGAFSLATPHEAVQLQIADWISY